MASGTIALSGSATATSTTIVQASGTISFEGSSSGSVAISSGAQSEFSLTGSSTVAVTIDRPEIAFELEGEFKFQFSLDASPGQEINLSGEHSSEPINLEGKL